MAVVISRLLAKSSNLFVSTRKVTANSGMPDLDSKWFRLPKMGQIWDFVRFDLDTFGHTIWSWSNVKEYGKNAEEVRIIQVAINLLVGPQTGILSNPPKFGLRLGQLMRIMNED